MLDPVLFPLFLSLVGSTAGALLKKAAEKHVEKFFGKALDKLASLGKKTPLQKAHELALGAWGARSCPRR